MENVDDDSLECFKRVEVVQEHKYDEKEQCRDTYYNKCFVSHTTTFEPSRIKECDEEFKKKCHIEYVSIATPQSVRICNEIAERNCQDQGPVVCHQEMETSWS